MFGRYFIIGHVRLCQERVSAAIRGDFLPNKFPGEFAGDSWVDFFALFIGTKKQEESTPTHSKFQIRIWELRGQHTHSKNLSLILSGALQELPFSNGRRPCLRSGQDLYREEKSVHYHHQKKNLLENFSGLKVKLSRPVVDTKTYKNQKNHIYHRNLSSVAPIFFSKEKFCTGAGRMFSFSQLYY